MVRLVRTAFRWIRATVAVLIGIAALIALLVLATCTVQGSRNESWIRSQLPQKLKPGTFLLYEFCNPISGGDVWIVEVAPDASRRLVSEGPGFLTQPEQGRSRGYSEGDWTPSEKTQWSTEYAKPHLWCLENFNVKGQNLADHLRRKGGYFHSFGRNSFYIVPSLNVAVGGSEPH